MNEDIVGSDVHHALDRLTDSEPWLGFTPAGVIAAGRRRRHRHTLAVGGTWLAAVAFIAAAVAVPTATWSNEPSTNTPMNAGGSGTASSQQPTPAPSPSEPSSDPQARPDSRGQAPAPTGAKTPSCPVRTVQQWNAHLAFEAKVRSLLPEISGTMTSQFSRTDRVCVSEAKAVWWTVTRGAGMGEVQGSVGRQTQPDLYRRWQQRSPCAGFANSMSTCSFTRHGQALVFVSHVWSAPSQGGSEEIRVQAIWSDNSGVSLSASSAVHGSAKTPPLSAAPLTELELIDLALNPVLRS